LKGVPKSDAPVRKIRRTELLSVTVFAREFHVCIHSRFLPLSTLTQRLRSSFLTLAFLHFFVFFLKPTYFYAGLRNRTDQRFFFSTTSHCLCWRDLLYCTLNMVALKLSRKVIRSSWSTRSISGFNSV